METRANYVLIGAFAAATVLAAFLFLIWLTGFEGEGELTAYDVIFDGSVAGLSEGGDVRYNGIKVGEVTQIALGADPRLVRTRISVDRRTPVKVDSEARLEFQGITGVAFIEITGGSPSSRNLEAVGDEDVPIIVADRSAVQQLITSAPALLTAANDLLVRVDRLLGENEGQLSATVRDVETVSGTVASNYEEIDAIIKNLAVASEQIAQITERMNGAVGQIQGAATSYGALAEDARALVAVTRPAAEQWANSSVPEMDRLLRDTRRMIGSVDRLVVELERNPTEFLLGEDPAEYGN
ncbi:MlaD family protein [Pyruvatibacter sp.]|uniref:MlaD family protein n=1 Tax=Pyruvatibacter sp. TaxID=1981328 RepID=UPI0032EE5F6D